jgi:hypothetical protein
MMLGMYIRYRPVAEKRETIATVFAAFAMVIKVRSFVLKYEDLDQHSCAARCFDAHTITTRPIDSKGSLSHKCPS